MFWNMYTRVKKKKKHTDTELRPTCFSTNPPSKTRAGLPAVNHCWAGEVFVAGPFVSALLYVSVDRCLMLFKRLPYNFPHARLPFRRLCFIAPLRYPASLVHEIFAYCDDTFKRLFFFSLSLINSPDSAFNLLHQTSARFSRLYLCCGGEVCVDGLSFPGTRSY